MLFDTTGEAYLVELRTRESGAPLDTTGMNFCLAKCPAICLQLDQVTYRANDDMTECALEPPSGPPLACLPRA
jgi:hypothetical protein